VAQHKLFSLVLVVMGMEHFPSINRKAQEPGTEMMGTNIEAQANTEGKFKKQIKKTCDIEFQILFFLCSSSISSFFCHSQSINLLHALATFVL
jgi:hypothetical protein